LEGLQRFFQQMPADSGMAFVVVVHLSAEHESMMAEILQRTTAMPVTQVLKPSEIQPNHVYVIPPGKQLSTVGGILSAVKMLPHKGKHDTVDLFFRLLAKSHGPQAIAIVLSGGDGDGATGLKSIKEFGGLTIAQDPSEAEQPNMPRAAIETGIVDWILPVDEMPPRLIEYQALGEKLHFHASTTGDRVPEELPVAENDEIALREVLTFLKTITGHDFSGYKRATILRRVGRRMQVNGAENLSRYLTFLRTHPGESGALLQDLLISVTNFFRDKEAFDALSAQLPKLFANKGVVDAVRVWVPGCATGEEAYSMAILLCEYAATLENPPQIQVFASDLDQAAVAFGREGRYPQSIATDVSEQRLQRFFVKEHDGYRVQRSVREMVLFATHDLLKDSPFSRLDLVSCRNVLIYLNRESQSEVFDVFHFALLPYGLLFLGSSETADDVGALFKPIDKEFRIYSRQPMRRVGLTLPAGASTLSTSVKARKGSILPAAVPEPVQKPGRPDGRSLKPELGARRGWAELHLKLIERIAPPSLVISRDYHIVHLSASAGKYLQFGGGEPSTELLRAVRPEFRTRLRAALFRAFKAKELVEIRSISCGEAGGSKLLDISVMPAEDLGLDYLLIQFHERDLADGDPETFQIRANLPDPQIVQHLEEELDQMKAGWRETVEQYEASLEELSASNEELQAMNEELRSATEELETGREELQSINEEVVTINQELKSNVEELRESNSDLQNLMASSQIATIFLDHKLQVKRFTPPATELFQFIPSDIGRPFSDLSRRFFDYPAITRETEQVLERHCFLEREVRNTDGRWFLARMFPYRNAAGHSAGVVITCVDITERKGSEVAMRLLSSIVESSIDAIISFTMDGEIVSWNRGAERVFGYTSEEAVGQPLSILCGPDNERERMELMDRLRRGETIDQFETIRYRKGGQPIDVSISASVLKQDAEGVKGGTAIFQDITARKKALAELQHVTDELERRVETRTAELQTRVGQLACMTSELTMAEQRERKRMALVLHDQLQQILVAAKMRVESIATSGVEPWKSEIMEVIGLLDEALANSRSLAVDLSPPILAEGLGRALEWLCGTWISEKYHLKVNMAIDPTIDARREDMRNLVFLAVKELLFNVVKHTTVKEATVELAVHDPGTLRVTVRDGGQGFDASVIGENLSSGSSFGLASLHERLEILGGSLKIESGANRGVEATILAPLKMSIQLPSP
jgi:two-component system, chemotaxis family, CheB/CheR fusion protein